MLVLVNLVEKNEVGDGKSKSIRKNRNKIVKILIRLKSGNLSNFKFKNLSRFKLV